jgi:hypothetical protein
LQGILCSPKEESIQICPKCDREKVDRRQDETAIFLIFAGIRATQRRTAKMLLPLAAASLKLEQNKQHKQSYIDKRYTKHKTLNTTPQIENCNESYLL